VNTFLKMLFDTHALRRFDKPKEERKRDNLIVLWADEARRFVTALEDGMSRLQLRRYYPRSAGHHRRRGANLPPHLSRHSAATKPGSSHSICNRVIFKAADEEGALESADFIAKAKMIKKSWGYSAAKISRNYSEQEEHKIKPHLAGKSGQHIERCVTQHSRPRKASATLASFANRNTCFGLENDGQLAAQVVATP
jgi:hypothetical protein